MNISLSFFAALLLTDESRLSYTIVKRKYNDGSPTLRHAGLKVQGIKNYVFDIETGNFVRLGKLSDSVIRAEKKVYLINSADDIILRDEEGRSIKYTQQDFLRVYMFRVVNSALN